MPEENSFQVNQENDNAFEQGDFCDPESNVGEPGPSSETQEDNNCELRQSPDLQISTVCSGSMTDEHIFVCSNGTYMSQMSYTVRGTKSETHKSDHFKFNPRGIRKHNDKVLLFGTESCILSDLDGFTKGVGKDVFGFEGNILDAQFLSGDIIAIATSIALYIYHKNISLTVADSSVQWPNNFQCSEMAYDTENNIFLVLSTAGKVIKILRENEKLRQDRQALNAYITKLQAREACDISKVLIVTNNFPLV